MRRLYIIPILLFALHLSLYAEATWKPKKYDAKEAERAYSIRNAHLRDVGTNLKRNMAIADSLYNAGEKSGNYAVQIAALEIKEQIYITSDQYDKIADVERQRMAIAKANTNAEMYFKAYYRYCFSQIDINPSEAFFEAKNMVEEAVKVGSRLGQMYGHEALGDIYLMQRSDGRGAVEEYSKTLELAKELKIGEVTIFQLHLDLSKAHMDCGRNDEAKKVLDEAKQLKVFENEDMQMMFYQAYIFLVDRIGTREEYDALHKKYILAPEAKTHFDDNSLFYFHIRWLIKMGRGDEALRLIPQLKLREMILECSHDAYLAMKDYKNAYNYLMERTMFKDSVRYEMSMGDIATMNAKLHNIELRQEADKAVQQRNLIATAAVMGFLLITIVSAFIIIHRQRKANQELAKTRDIAIKANEMKSQFIQNMSHEFRTPINHVYGYAQLLNEESVTSDNDNMKEMTRAICKGSESLVGMIEDIIMISNIDTSTEEVTLKDVTLSEIIENAISLASPKLNTNMVEIKTVLDVAGDTTIKTNRDMFIHMLRNIISNAIKFTKTGEIVVRASKDDNQLVLSVTDTGCGIAAEHREHIFERFYKADSFVPGAGLGLSVCRTIAEKIGATVSLDDTYKESGSRFIIKVS